MPYTVPYSFDRFYENINLGGDHRDTAAARRENVASHLAKHFDVLEVFSTGSIPKYTALKDAADLDVMVAFHYGKHIQGKTPAEVLGAVRDALKGLRTGGRRNGQAVTLYYQTWPNVDIVPVSRTLAKDGTVLHYNVPDTNTGRWIKAKPKHFSSTIESKANKCGKNFRRIIKMIKHWNTIHGRYLSGYHIEVIAAKIFDDDLDDLMWNVFKFFSEGKKTLQHFLWHDLSFVDEYLSSEDRAESIKRFSTAEEKSRAAWYLTYNGRSDHKGAIEKWRQVFGDKFPAYG